MKNFAAIVFGGVSFVAMFAVGANGGSSVSGGRNFDFDAATMEEREEWLERQSRPMARGLRWSLPDGTGFAPRMELVEVIPHGRSRRIEFVIQLQEQGQISNNPGAVRTEMLRKTCASFVKLPIYDHNVSVQQTFKYMHGGVAMRLNMSPRDCDSELRRQAAAA